MGNFETIFATVLSAPRTIDVMESFPNTASLMFLLTWPDLVLQ